MKMTPAGDKTSYTILVPLVFTAKQQVYYMNFEKVYIE